MLKNESIAYELKRLWVHIGRRRRIQFLLLLILIVIASIAEVVSIGAILPFLAVLTNPEHIFELPSLKPLFLAINISNHNDLVIPAAILFGLLALISGAIRMLLLYVSGKISFLTGVEISARLYEKALFQPYSFHCSRNSSELISSITQKAYSTIFGVILPSATFVGSITIFILTLVFLLVVETQMTLVTMGGFGSIYFATFFFSRRSLQENSEIIAHENDNVIQSLQEGFGGIREILLDGNQKIFTGIYRKADSLMRRAQFFNFMISSSPRYIIESLGLLFIVILACILSRAEGGLNAAIPSLGLLVLSIQKL